VIPTVRTLKMDHERNSDRGGGLFNYNSQFADPNNGRCRIGDASDGDERMAVRSLHGKEFRNMLIDHFAFRESKDDIVWPTRLKLLARRPRIEL